MTCREITQFIVDLAGPLLIFGGILIGVWKFNKGQENIKRSELRQRKLELDKISLSQKFEAISKFKEIQLTKYMEAAETVSSLVHTEEYQSAEFKKGLKRFWQLYWVELSAVEDGDVEGRMKELGDYIRTLGNRGFESITDSEKKDLQDLGYEVAQAIKVSYKNWSLHQLTPER